MSSQRLALDAQTALAYVGQTVLVELHWDDEPESFWCCLHIIGVMFPVDGVYEHGCFMTLELNAQDKFPREVYFSDICTIRAMRHRDRRSSGNVLGRMTLTHSADVSGSRAALPARRDSFTVPSNGSTGAAHP
ncbi:hypothetical protein [Stutzerimonas nitrititolerans]|uniref:hypothetical protein n=1 Tax=Stutzerimonas nitrititolerans TaxID=2482751 RepID=UPI0028ABE364|nr:hypothetical protein [Stutzerimonas nitrititolerans]